ncbi:homeobox protein PKNOX1-like [Toxorhynchites rutilus septentrionalis]|uniref:homeobox protein PKNOX1-like n=1 Tax=Toxorhynchites rutilus septentrionalis TaxID=329112 RepID=UPI00247A7144|nr:homeobox protein PKNOX1-like [Toxorhynchites rutilus septentrionalis]XP_055631603.1 homeobox protein PKNOX1-like [Toxorhynchites rutilus septentrionalis]XP_055631604.1 homeobox protein PKNOX1-like [Toxorhynchites rutilus septentrionalis]XP_055631605.1 homeobox protein PKNOX1-like [Toxorhynchites rutilus septentrionalis]
MQENSVAAVPVSGATVTAPALSGNGHQVQPGGGGSGNGGHTSSNSASGPTPVSSPTNSSTTSISEIDQAQFEADKRAVYKHPLFSLLALLLEKCEQATQGYISSSNSSSPNGSTNGTSDGDSFSRDVQAFVQMLEKEKRPLLTNNSELDGLMIKALQVLRIHLLELEKVQELCRDFCTRYIACLRGKMQSENLLRSDYAMEHNNNLSNSNSPINSPEQDLSGSAQGYYQNTDYLTGTDANEYSNMQGSFNQPPRPNPEQQIPKHLQIPPQADIFRPALPLPPNPSHTIVGTTPLSQIGLSTHPLLEAFASGQLSPGGSSDELDSELDAGTDDLGGGGSDIDGGGGSGKRCKRGILPKHATSVMRAWLFQHLVHPYPTEDEKRAIAAQTNLTLLQVNNWFINARRRILQPMLEHVSDNSAQSTPPPPSSSSQPPLAMPTNHHQSHHSSKQHCWSDNPTEAPGQAPPLQLANIENISANINRALDTDRPLLTMSSRKLASVNEFFQQQQQQQRLLQNRLASVASSEDESNDAGSLLIGGHN